MHYDHLNEELLLEMSEIGRFEGFKICIYGGEGPVPHFHFENKQEGISGCLRLDKPEYFDHSKHKDKLSRKDLKKMINFLKSPHRHFGKFGMNNWRVICIYWDDDNAGYPFNKEAEMPNYELLLN